MHFLELCPRENELRLNEYVSRRETSTFMDDVVQLKRKFSEPQSKLRRVVFRTRDFASKCLANSKNCSTFWSFGCERAQEGTMIEFWVKLQINVNNWYIGDFSDCKSFCIGFKRCWNQSLLILGCSAYRGVFKQRKYSSTIWFLGEEWQVLRHCQMPENKRISESIENNWNIQSFEIVKSSMPRGKQDEPVPAEARICI